MDHTESQRQLLTPAQWVDVIALVVVMLVYVVCQLLVGTGWWSIVILVVQLGLLVRIARWIIPLIKQHRR